MDTATLINIIITVLSAACGGLATWMWKMDSRIFHMHEKFVNREELVELTKEMKYDLEKVSTQSDARMDRLAQSITDEFKKINSNIDYVRDKLDRVVEGRRSSDSGDKVL